MNKLILTGLLFNITLSSFAQIINEIINPIEVERIERILSADDMEGRKTFTVGNEKAAAFIANEFKAAGLQTLTGSNNYLQEFVIVHPQFSTTSGFINGEEIESKNIIAITSSPSITINEKSGYEKVSINKGDNLSETVNMYIHQQKNLLVMVDTSFSKSFPRLNRIKKNILKSEVSVIFILSTKEPVTYSIEVKQETIESRLANVVGIMPGKSKKEEYVIFSGHYDHLGIGKPNNTQDSIYNGANDDAAGTTAVIMLAKYFAQQKSNERTLIFVAFTAEELGGLGSQYFSKQFVPEKIISMFNIEMIGTQSKWGTNSAYITGFEKTNIGEILQKNLNKTNFAFYPDPYPDQQLFYRSDNSSLAKLGVPAHTISTSKMDNEKYYHTLDDEIETLDIKNMTEIIKAIALSSQSIVNGKEAPTRVNLSVLGGTK
ncbi:MAG TPA: M28 family peptidase [Chitinophagaceae bacterium]|nr:M28 family peptidase [Chitinophagaceae bacterium]